MRSRQGYFCLFLGGTATLTGMSATLKGGTATLTGMCATLKGVLLCWRVCVLR